MLYLVSAFKYRIYIIEIGTKAFAALLQTIFDVLKTQKRCIAIRNTKTQFPFVFKYALRLTLILYAQCFFIDVNSKSQWIESESDYFGHK